MGVRPEALMRLVHQQAHLLGRWKVSGGDIRGIHCRVGGHLAEPPALEGNGHRLARPRDRCQPAAAARPARMRLQMRSRTMASTTMAIMATNVTGSVRSVCTAKTRRTTTVSRMPVISTEARDPVSAR